MDETTLIKAFEDYIKSRFPNLDFISLFESYNASYDNKQVYENSLMKAINNIGNDDNTKVEIKNWSESVTNNNNIVLQSDHLTEYWSLKLQISRMINTQYNNLRRETFISQRVEKVSDQVMNSMSAPATVSPSNTSPASATVSASTTQNEKDSVSFNNVTVGTTIKNYALNKANDYNNLSDNEKYLINLGLNSILNLSDNREQGQTKLFGGNNWKLLKSLHKNKEIKIQDDLENFLKPIDKALRSLNYEKAYIAARELEINSSGDKRTICSIYAHIINAYHHRKKIFKNNNNNNTKSNNNNNTKSNNNNSSNSNNASSSSNSQSLPVTDAKSYTEYDTIIKLWGEIFELLVDKEVMDLKWGESVMKFSTYAKRFNYEQPKNVIGFKVDGRMLSENLLDISPLEAARFFDLNEIHSDRSKLLTESKIIIDQLVTLCSSLDIEKLKVVCIQIQGNRASMIKTRLVDHGLYVGSGIGSLSIPPQPFKFARDSHIWFSKLMYYLKNLRKLNALTNRYNNGDSQGSFTDLYDDPNFKKLERDNQQYKLWIRPTFFPPHNKQDPVIPSDVFNPPNFTRNTRQRR